MAIINLTPARGGIQAPRPIQQDGRNPAGAALAGLGAALTQLGEVTAEAARANQLADARARHLTAIADLRTETDDGIQQEDGTRRRLAPGEIVPHWDRRREEIRRGIADSISDTRAREAFLRDAEVYEARERREVARVQTVRTAEEGQAQAERELPQLARVAAAARSPAERADAVNAAMQSIDQRVATGVFSPVQGERLRAGFLGQMDQADVLRLLNRSPGEAARLLADPSQFPNLDPIQRERLFGTAQNAAQAAAARAEAAAARRERAVMVEFQQFNGMLQAGIVPEDRAARVVEMARGTALEGPIRQAVADGRALAGFTLASNDQQMAQLAEAEARARSPNATDADLAQFNRLRQAQQAQRTAYQQDGLGRAVAEGIVPPQPPIDWMNPATLNSRVEAAQGVSARRGFAISPFNREDLAAGVEAFTRATPDQKLAIVGAVAQIADPQVRAAAIQHFERARGDAGRLPPGTLARVADMLRAGTVETQQAARRLIGDLTADVSDRARQAGESSEMRSALVSAQDSGVQRVRVRQAELAGGGPYAAVVSRDMDAIQRAAAARMASGEASATRAVEAAAATFNAGLAVVDDTSLGHVYFPASAGTPAQVRQGMRVLRDQAAAVSTDPALGADQAQTAIARREAARRAVWINEGGTFALVARGQAGAPVVLRTATLDEVVRAAEGEAARVEATPPRERSPVLRDQLREGQAAARRQREMTAPPVLQ